MSEITGEGGSVPITPREVQMYKNEYKHGAQLFQKALEQYTQSTNPYQQKEFQEVMDKALLVLNETAKELHNEKLQQQNAKISSDYEKVMQTPTDASAAEQLHKDLDRAKKSV